MIRPSSMIVLSVISDLTAFEYTEPYIHTHSTIFHSLHAVHRFVIDLTRSTLNSLESESLRRTFLQRTRRDSPTSKLMCRSLTLMPSSHRRHGQNNTVCNRTFPNCFVQSWNAARTIENSLDLSPILSTTATRTRQDRTVLSCLVGGVS